jgi:hypothetical protein
MDVGMFSIKLATLSPDKSVIIHHPFKAIILILVDVLSWYTTLPLIAIVQPVGVLELL